MCSPARYVCMCLLRSAGANLRAEQAIRNKSRITLTHTCATRSRQLVGESYPTPLLSRSHQRAALEGGRRGFSHGIPPHSPSTAQMDTVGEQCSPNQHLRDVSLATASRNSSPHRQTRRQQMLCWRRLPLLQGCVCCGCCLSATCRARRRVPSGTLPCPEDTQTTRRRKCSHE